MSLKSQPVKNQKRTAGQAGKAVAAGVLFAAAEELLASKPVVEAQLLPDLSDVQAPEGGADTAAQSAAEAVAVDVPQESPHAAAAEVPAASAELAELLAQLTAENGAALAAPLEEPVLLADAGAAAGGSGEVVAQAAEATPAPAPAGAGAEALAPAAEMAASFSMPLAVVGGLGVIGAAAALDGGKSGFRPVVTPTPTPTTTPEPTPTPTPTTTPEPTPTPTPTPTTTPEPTPTPTPTTTPEPTPTPTPTPTTTPEPTPTPEPTHDVSGRVIDGPVANARVFYDADGDGVWDDLNNNGQWDEGDELFAFTDANGNFSLPGITLTAQGRLVVEAGGMDTETGNIVGTLMAPLFANGAGNIVVSPLSMVLALNPTLDPNVLKAALGLPADVDLLAFDPFAAMESGNATQASLGVQVFAAQQQLYALVRSLTELAAGADNQLSFIELQAALTAVGEALAAGGTREAVIQAAVNSLASNPALDLGLTNSQIAQITQVIQDSSQAIGTAYAATSPNGLNLASARALVLAGDPSAPNFAEAVALLAGARAAASVSQTALLQVVDQVSVGGSYNAGSLQSTINAQSQQYADNIANDVAPPPPVAVGHLTDAQISDVINAGAGSNAALDALVKLLQSQGIGRIGLDDDQVVTLASHGLSFAPGTDLVVSGTSFLSGGVSAGAVHQLLDAADVAVSLDGSARAAVLQGDSILDDVLQRLQNAGMDRLQLTAAQVNELALDSDLLTLNAGVQVDVTSALLAGGTGWATAEQLKSLLDAADVTVHLSQSDVLRAQWGGNAALDDLVARLEQSGMDKLALDDSHVAALARDGNHIAAGTDVLVTGTSFLSGGVSAGAVHQLLDAADVAVALDNSAMSAVLQGDHALDSVLQRLQNAGMDRLQLTAAQVNELALDSDLLTMNAGVQVDVTSALLAGGAGRATAEQLKSLLDAADVTVHLSQSDVLRAQWGGNAALDDLVARLEQSGMDKLALDDSHVAALARDGNHIAAGTDVLVTGTSFLGSGVSADAVHQLLEAADVAVALDDSAMSAVLQGDYALDSMVQRLQNAGMDRLELTAAQVNELALDSDLLTLNAGVQVDVTSALLAGGAGRATAEQLKSLLDAADVTVHLSQSDVLRAQWGGNGALDDLVARLEQSGMDKLALDDSHVAALARDGNHIAAGTDVLVTGTSFLSGGVSAGAVHQLLDAADVAVALDDSAMSAVLQGDHALDSVLQRLQNAGMDRLQLTAAQVNELALDSDLLTLNAGVQVDVTSALLAGGAGRATAEQLKSLLDAADVTVHLSQSDVLRAQWGGNAALDDLVARLEQSGMDTLALDDSHVAALARDGNHIATGTDVLVTGTSFLGATGVSGNAVTQLLSAADVAVALTDTEVGAVAGRGDASLDDLVQKLQSAGMDTLRLDAVQVNALAQAGTQLTLDAGTEVTITSDFVNGTDTTAALASLLGSAEVTVQLSQQDVAAVVAGGNSALDDLVNELHLAGMDVLALDQHEVAAMAHAGLHLGAGTDVSVTGTHFLGTATNAELTPLLDAANVTVHLTGTDLGQILAGSTTDEHLDALTTHLSEVGVDALLLDAGQALALASAAQDFTLDGDLDIRLDNALSLTQAANEQELDKLGRLLGGADVTAELDLADLRQLHLNSTEALGSAITTMEEKLAAMGVDSLEISDELADVLAEAGVRFTPGAGDQPFVGSTFQGQEVVVRAEEDIPGDGAALLQASLLELQQLGVDRVVATGGATDIGLSLGGQPGFELYDLPTFEPAANVHLVVTESDLAALLSSDGFNTLHAANIDHLVVRGTDELGTSLNELYGQALSASGLSLDAVRLTDAEVQLLGLGAEPANPLDPFNKHPQT